MNKVNRKQLWDLFYSEVIGNILTTGLYNDTLTHAHNATSFNLWIKNMRNHFETEDVETLKTYTHQWILEHK